MTLSDHNPHPWGTSPTVIIPMWVMDADISDRAKLLFGFIQSDLSERDGVDIPRRSLADRMNCSTDSIDRAMKELVNSGAVVVERRTYPDGSQAPNGYGLVFYPQPEWDGKVGE